MNARRSFLAFMGGTAFTGAVTQHAGHAAAGDHVTIRNADEARLIAWYRAASPAEKQCVDRFVVRLSDGEVWASAVGRLLSDLAHTVPRDRTLRV